MRRMRYRLRSLIPAALVVASIALAAWQAASAGQQTASLIITGGTVVTVDSAHHVFSPGAVVVNGRDILAVDRADAIAKRFTAAQTIDATGQVVLPGLINTHGHAPMVLYRGLADDLALMDWLQNYIFP